MTPIATRDDVSHTDTSMQDQKAWYREHPNFLDSLSEDLRAEIEAMGRPRHFHKGEIIFRIHDAGDQIGILKKGTVKAFLVDRDGREIILAIRRPGNLIGMTAIFASMKRVSYISAIEEVGLLMIKTEDMRKFVGRHSDVAVLLNKILCIRLHHSRMIIEDLSTKNVQERLIRLLLNLADDAGTGSEAGIEINTRLTHEMISQIVASSRQTVTMILNDLSLKNYIKREKRKIILTNPQKLKELI